MEIISFENISYQYPTRGGEDYALRDLDFTVSEGECLAFQGPTGSGKSTVCLAMNGIIPHVFGGKLKGEILIDGVNTKSSNVANLAKVVGLMFQDPETQFVGMTVEDELFFGAGNYGIPREVIKERSNWALDLLRLRGYEKREPSTLSGGEKQRVALAAILVMRPKILVLDEPTSELDPLGASEVYESLQILKKELGITIIITSHQSESLPGLADRIIILEEGRKILEGTPESIYQQSKLLTDVGVRIPQVVQFWNGLSGKLAVGIEPAPITLDVAVKNFRDLLQARKVQIVQPHEQICTNKTSTDTNVSGSPIIQVKNLSYNYPSGPLVLDKINLDINSGDYVAIIGQNGAGKTTLVKHFNGLLKSTKGEVFVFGKETHGLLTSKLSHRVSYAFQNPDHQIFRPTVWDEVAFGPQNLGFDDNKVEQAVDHALSLVGLEDQKDNYPFSMGKGNRQKLAVASVIAMETEVIIIDEPTTGLDWKTSNEILKLMKMLNDMGRTIIVITHNMELVADNVLNTIVMYKGKILLQGQTRSVLSQIDELRKTYIEPPQITQFANNLKEDGFPTDTTTVPAALDVVSPL